MISNDEKSKKIIRYLNYQKIKVNLNVLKDIKSINNNTQRISNISYNQLKRIKKLNIIFASLKEKDYYIFILECLPNYLIRNIYRTFSYQWIRHKNESDKGNICRLKNNILKINHQEKIKDLLVEEFEYLEKNNQNFVDFFINCINGFFI